MRDFSKFVGRYVILLAIAGIGLLANCKSSGRTDAGIFGAADETEEAAKLVSAANEELTKIKILYKTNEGKREELKKALADDDAAAVKKITDDVVYVINDGAIFGKEAVDKIEQAQDMHINDDYKEYLRLKEESLKRQLEAFENYRQAARSLRDNYDPKNTQQRDKVKEEFKTRSENYRKIMEKARDFSSNANELAKSVLRRESNQ